jgi:hypothetical protein
LRAIIEAFSESYGKENTTMRMRIRVDLNEVSTQG